MSEVIVEVQSVLPATGWFFSIPSVPDVPIDIFDPVVVFAQVLVFDSRYPTLGVKKRVLPLGVDYYSDPSALVGEDASAFAREIFYITQHVAPGAD